MECTSDAVSTEMSISVPFAVASWLESKSYLGLFIFLYLYTPPPPKKKEISVKERNCR